MLKSFSLNEELLFINIIMIYLAVIFIIQKIQQNKEGIFTSKFMKLLKSQSYFLDHSVQCSYKKKMSWHKKLVKVSLLTWRDLRLVLFKVTRKLKEIDFSACWEKTLSLDEWLIADNRQADIYAIVTQNQKGPSTVSTLPILKPLLFQYRLIAYSRHENTAPVKVPPRVVHPPPSIIYSIILTLFDLFFVYIW